MAPDRVKWGDNMAETDNLLTYVRMALYDGKLKEYALDYAKRYMQTLTPVGTVVSICGKSHPYYSYGGSWELLDSGYFTANADRYLGLENHGESYCCWTGLKDDWTTYQQVINTVGDFWNISKLTGRRGLDVPQKAAPDVGDKVDMNPVPMEMAIPSHRHVNGYKVYSIQANNRSLFVSRNTMDYSGWSVNPNYNEWVPELEDYGDTYHALYREDGGATFEPPYLNVLMWRKISTDTGATGAVPLDGYDKPDNPLFT